MTSQFAFRASPPNQTAAVSPSSSSPPPSSIGGAGGGAPSSTRASPPPPAPPRCCDTGRPIFQDPVTGQTVCSCQYELLSYQRLAQAGVPLSMYSAPYSDAAAAAGMAAYFPALAGDQAPFYTNASGGIDLKENLAAGAASWPYPSVYHPYDAAFAGYPFNGYGMDLNGARRKNATRETTSTLKAWLNEHKKNPYPTKGEKIMLAIITKMTLTQVSTWFANARRRLKKENKMTWEPRNRVEDDDNNNDDDDHKSTDGKDVLDSKDSGTGSSEDGDRAVGGGRLESGGGAGGSWSGSRPGSTPGSPEPPYLPPAYLPARRPPPQPVTKPRIWSLADMASKDSEPSVAASRLLPAHPYRPDLYRQLYGPPPTHGAPDMALLETYSRLGAQRGPLDSYRLSAQRGPLSVLSRAAAAAGGALGLPPSGAAPPARASPSSSSTSSLSEQAPSAPHKA